jgi:hypothetical protein
VCEGGREQENVENGMGKRVDKLARHQLIKLCSSENFVKRVFSSPLKVPFSSEHPETCCV